MEPAVWVALSSLAVAIWTAFWTSRQNEKSRDAQRSLSEQQNTAQADLERLKHDLQRAATAEDRRLDAREQLRSEMARYRVPLLDAADDLGHRINNIRNNQFLAYLSCDHPRRDIAVLSTVYRLARYFGTLETLYGRVNYLRFERDDDTRAVAAVLADIGRTFASDEYDRHGPFHTSRFMIWREEQRAMGEVVRRGEASDTSGCVGFTTFAANEKTRDSVWFDNFARDLEAGDAADSERLATLQSQLAQLVRLLDEEGRYADPNEPEWMKSAAPTRTRAW